MTKFQELHSDMEDLGKTNSEIAFNVESFLKYADLLVKDLERGIFKIEAILKKGLLGPQPESDLRHNLVTFKDLMCVVLTTRYTVSNSDQRKEDQKGRASLEKAIKLFQEALVGTVIDA